MSPFLDSANVFVCLRQKMNDLVIHQESIVVMQDNSGAMQWAVGRPAEGL